MKCQHVLSPVQKNWLSAALAGELNDAKQGCFHQSAIVHVNQAQMLITSSDSPAVHVSFDLPGGGNQFHYL